MPGDRYSDYYLVKDEELEDSVDIPIVPQKKMFKKTVLILLLVIILLSVIALILAFIVFPITVMLSVSLQQNLIFTHSNLPTNKNYYEEFRLPGLKNHYVRVKDIDSGSDLFLGLWHILPFELADVAINNSNYDYDGALLNSNYSVLLYFHGTGEDRSQSVRKYQLFRNLFHIVVFDYRGYGDSSKGELFEKNVVSDSIEVFNWLQNRTNSDIYVWGHSIGASLASNMLSQLKNNGNISGLILEASFTSLKDELYIHPYVKYLAWLPWFRATVITPLENNGFVFNNTAYIKLINSSIMFLHAKDDEIVPYTMSEKLYNMSISRDNIEHEIVLHLFDKSLKLNHYFIYEDPYTLFFIYDFMKKQSYKSLHFFKGSHQS